MHKKITEAGGKFRARKENCGVVVYSTTTLSGVGRLKSLLLRVAASVSKLGLVLTSQGRLETMLPRLVQQMSASVTCRLCSELMDDAMGLPCGHTYCADCLLTATKDEYVCPECGVPFFLEDLNRVYALRETIEICRSLTQTIPSQEDAEWDLGALVMVSRNLKPGFNREGGLARVTAKVGTSYRVNYLMSRGNDIVAASDITKYEASPCRTRRASRNESQKKIVVTGVVGTMSDELRVGAHLNGVLQHRGLGATHIVCVGGALKRSAKLLSAWATAEAVVRDEWLLASAREGKPLPVDDYLVHDPDKERDWGISVAETLASRKLALHGYSVFASANCALRLPPNLNQIVESAGGVLIDVEPDYRAIDRLVVIDDQAPNRGPHITLNVDQFLRAILRKRLPIPHDDTVLRDTASLPSQPVPEIAMADDDDDESKTLLSLTPDPALREAPHEESLPLTLDASFDPTSEHTLDLHGLDALFAWGDEMKEAYEAKHNVAEPPRHDATSSIASHGNDTQQQPATSNHLDHGADGFPFAGTPHDSPPHSIRDNLARRTSPPRHKDKLNLVQRNITAYAPHHGIKRRSHGLVGGSSGASKKQKRTSSSSSQSSRRLPLRNASPGWLNVQRTMRSYFGTRAYHQQQDVVA